MDESQSQEPGAAGARGYGATVTQLLNRWNQGDREAVQAVLPLVYDELRRLAGHYFRRERADHTLQPTALVHEVYLKLAKQGQGQWNDRSHFIGVAACLMRRALIDHCREHAAQKRGGGQHKLQLDEELDVRARPEHLLALDQALSDLERLDATKALIVELRYFGGLSVAETAECLGISERSVARQWQVARAMLYSQLRGDAPA